ncbi:MAG: hypothetical protein PHD48_04950 [Alphaproteobacteria bacterium]|nr:hypothetical protein [Alphaproteobacteria bacterium]
MDTTSQILSGLFGVAIVILIAPRILAVNQGKILRNMALWVAIFLLLALAYKNFGPVDPNQANQSGSTATSQAQDDLTDKEAPLPDMQINEENGFSPPQGD